MEIPLVAELDTMGDKCKWDIYLKEQFNPQMYALTCYFIYSYGFCLLSCGAMTVETSISISKSKKLNPRNSLMQE